MKYNLVSGSDGISYLAKKRGADLVVWSLTVGLGLLLAYSILASLR